MIRPAILGTEQVICAGPCDFEPGGCVALRQHVHMQSEGRDKEAMDYIFRNHDQLDGPADWDVQRADFALTFGMLKFPHPLLGDDEQRQRVRWRPKGGAVHDSAPTENKNKDYEWR